MNTDRTSTLLDSMNFDSEESRKMVFEFLESIKLINKDEKAYQTIMDSIKIKKFKKGSFILMEGDILYMCYYIIKGCVREYYIIDGEEKTTNFYLEKDSINSSTGGKKKVPAKYFLECLEDTIVSTSSEEQEKEMFKKFPEFESLCRIQMEELVGEYQEKMAMYITSTAEERYLNLQKNRPELLDRVPQYQLASYIGVKPETLSRIRKRISKKR